ncbi:hypothetical protein [Marinobacter shengliensis]|uniref:hypothetical protein n=1 Tax=Marinobacter shengliensis TaxID=1389223 RepID=UPI00110801E2|nr:hypothetical protein [Marinobacter shengliensis]
MQQIDNRDHIIATARRLFQVGGELEIDDHADIKPTDENGHRPVACWVWVTREQAGIGDMVMPTMDDAMDAYAASAEHPSVQFDPSPDVSAEAFDGGYVAGWVEVPVDELIIRYSRLVVLACMSSGGTPALFTTSVTVTEEEYQAQKHIGLATDKAKAQGYEPPFIPFDDNHAPALAAAAQRMEELGGPVPVDRKDQHGVPEARDYTVKVTKQLQYDELEFSVRAAGVDVARDIAMDRAIDMDANEAGETITVQIFD